MFAVVKYPIVYCYYLFRCGYTVTYAYCTNVCADLCGDNSVVNACKVNYHNLSGYARNGQEVVQIFINIRKKEWNGNLFRKLLIINIDLGHAEACSCMFEL